MCSWDSNHEMHKKQEIFYNIRLLAGKTFCVFRLFRGFLNPA
jgi:hypothetical protein